MNQQYNINTPKRSLIFFCLVVFGYIYAIYTHLGAELADDGAFFLRYAENMANGEFWVWNQGETPIWGASAPLFPLVIAGVMKLGVEPIDALVGSSIVLSAFSLAAVSLMLAQRVSLNGGLAFGVFSILDSYVMWFSGAGLETPLTFLLLAMGVWILLYEPKEWFVGIVVGLLMVNKLDLLPVGALLLIAYWLKRGRLPTFSLMIASGLTAAWYGFAWVYFGAPVPNSFLTKSLYQANLPKTIDWTWFAGIVLWAGVHKWLVGLSVLAVLLKKCRPLPLYIFLGGTVVVHLIAYTIKYPFEPYNWYAMPSVFGLLVLAAIGLQATIEYFLERLPKSTTIARVTISTILLVLVVGISYKEERWTTSVIKSFLNYQESDRAEAGRWVAENTPLNFRVYTMWGNPAYYSKRYVLDGSFLNRKFEDTNLVRKYRPEILIMQNNPGSSPADPVFADHVNNGYRVVKVFDKTYSVGMDYFYAVLAREDVVGQVRNVELPRDLMRFISRSEIGDHFGILKANGSSTLFVHPGFNTSTIFDFDVTEFAKSSGQKSLKLEMQIAPNVPDEAVKRGAANVKVIIMSGANIVTERIITKDHPYEYKITVDNNPKLTVIVDNNGNPDTDWLNLSIR